MAPVPVYVKGGVWSNLEDQIVKAAIQKYGTHQWSKVASLLQKKSAKQCETRWNEYLNPKLNFTEFTKEEDARLLDLARRLPNQWRTIADGMGRTAQVCIDRYNRLLEGDEHDSELSLGSSLEFKAGDLNPKSETQVAKPDNIELADDEREMLAEARARLLNTQGKKATRKIRERMLEESKRIAQLQKRRELKQAGVKTDIRKPKKKYDTEIDYNMDVAYEQAPVSGIYDTSKEDERLARNLQKFQMQVDRRGLKDDNEKESLKQELGKSKKSENKSKINDAGLKIASNGDTAVINEYKKPILLLPRPGVRKAVIEDDVQVKRQKIISSIKSHSALKLEEPESASIAWPIERTEERVETVAKPLLEDLFGLLPKPKNDFEIVLDDEDSNAEDEVGSNEGSKSQYKKENMSESQDESTTVDDIKVPLKLQCLEKTQLPLPAFNKNPKDEFELTFNEIVASAMLKEPFLQFGDCQDYLEDVENEMQITGLTKDAVPPQDYNFPSQTNLMDSIRAKLDKIKDLQTDLSYVSPLMERNDKFSRKICGEQLPNIRALQHRYFVNYRMYQDELRGIEDRKQRLIADIAGNNSY